VKPLESYYLDAVTCQGVKAEDIVFILSSAATAADDAAAAETFLSNKFPGVVIKFNDAFEGMENSVVFNLTNGSLEQVPTIIPWSLTRATNHLVIFCEDTRDILKEAAGKGLVKVGE
jgi:hypothetical protein